MTNLVITNIAKATIAAWMVADANNLINSMELTYVPRIKPADIKMLRPIDVNKGYGGVIKTEWLHVAWEPSGKIENMVRLTNGYEIYASAEEDAWNVTNKSKIDEAQAYKMATNWLRRAGVDMTAIESRVSAKTTQLRVTDLGLLPMFEVKWSNIVTNDPLGAEIEVQLNGHLLQVTSFHLNGRSGQFVTRPSIFSPTNLLTLKTNSQPVTFTPAIPGEDPRKKP